VVTIAPQDVPVAFEFVAQTQSSRQVNIQARVSGFLDRRVYTEGSMVKEGQALFLMATGGGWVELAAKAADTPPQPSQPTAPQKASPKKQDRIEVKQQGDISVVNVYRVTGIGGAQVNAPKSGWPPAVFVRLHGFPALESFRATSKAAKLECALARPEGQPPRQDCRLGNAKVDAIERMSDYFEVKLPHAMLTADNASIEVQWVDQWR
jgi:hypothetical protein